VQLITLTMSRSQAAEPNAGSVGGGAVCDSVGGGSVGGGCVGGGSVGGGSVGGGSVGGGSVCDSFGAVGELSFPCRPTYHKDYIELRCVKLV